MFPTNFLVGVSVLLMACVPCHGQTTYFVRADGGSTTQCTGTFDAPYPGFGVGQPCAWDHPFRALPPGGSPVINGGDTLVVAAGDYRMGYGAPGDDGCEQAWSWDCHMPPVPSGLDSAHRTRILGQGWSTGCVDAPQLWGAERPWFILNLSGSEHVEVACLEITDRSSCIESHVDGQTRCERNEPPFGPWAPIGVHAEDSTDVVLRDLDVHGLAAIGIHAARLQDWTLEDVRVAGNGWAGWDGDLWDGGGDANTGELVFRRVEVVDNGCAEDPDSGFTIRATCWGQQSGGYGDGFAAGSSGGHWLFEDCVVRHNTSDGVDLLYLEPSASVDVIRLRAEGNAGNQLKVSSDVSIVNSQIVGNCAFFEDLPHFQGAAAGDNCRAAGNAVAFNLHPGTAAEISSTTVAGQGDCLLEVACESGGCDGTEQVLVRNVLFSGATDWYQPWELTCLYWYDDQSLPFDPVDFDFNLVWQTKGDPCPGVSSVCEQNPLLVNGDVDFFDGHLMPTSPAVDAGTANGAPPRDLDGNERDDQPDIGAFEGTGYVFADGFEDGHHDRWSWATPSS